MAFDYPDSFPCEEAEVVFNCMNGFCPDCCDCRRACWVLAGYAAYLTDCCEDCDPSKRKKPDTTPLDPNAKTGTCPCPKVSEVKSALKAAIDATKGIKGAGGKPVGITLPNVPWGQLMTLLLKSLQEGLQILIDANT